MTYGAIEGVWVEKIERWVKHEQLNYEKFRTKVSLQPFHLPLALL